MFYSVLSSLFVSSVLTIIDVCANPLPLPLVGLNVPINRSHRYRPPVNSSSLPKREADSMKLKYHDVSKNLKHASPFLDIIATPEAEAEAAFIPPEVLGYKMPLKDYISGNLDMMYYGSAHFGTPPQKLTLDIDTGSADCWVPVDCPDCTNKQFEDTKSSTRRNSGEDFSVFYGSGDVSGVLMQDTVSIAGLEIPDHFFGAVSAVSDDFNGLPNDGLLGLAFSSIAQSGKPTFFETLIAKGMLPAPMFSVHLSRNQADGSEISFGGIDYSKTLGLIEWVPVLTKAYWSVSMDAVTVNTQELPTQFNAIIDTGTTLIYVPDTLAAAIYAMIPGSSRAPQFGPGSHVFPEFYTYPCSTKPDIVFSFSRTSFSISPTDFNLGLTELNSPDCVGGILALQDFPSNIAIIGDLFLKSWYSIYDYSGGPGGSARVGFSRSINNE
ncbi:aspartic peptidase domain-containing protein [Mycena capillaripes]|nr:aspartic peptidase domain-containing protein [Mycena capillaripes]